MIKKNKQIDKYKYDYRRANSFERNRKILTVLTD